MDPRLGTLRTPPREPRDAGITLIELLVVTAVLAVLAVGVSLTAVRSSASSAAASDLEWFRTQFNTQRSLALQDRTTRGVSVSSKGLSVATKRPTTWDTKPPARPWRGKVTLGRTTPRSGFGTPDIVLLSTGQSTAFEVVFSNRQGRAARCSSDGWTGLICSDN